MILAVSTRLNNGQQSLFVDKILKGIKKHSIRPDRHNRWESGKTIHFVTGVMSKNYDQFSTGTCKSVQKIEISRKNAEQMLVKVDGKTLCIDEIKILAANDGFDTLRDLFDFFVPTDIKLPINDQKNHFSGKLIHWTDLRY